MKKKVLVRYVSLLFVFSMLISLNVNAQDKSVFQSYWYLKASIGGSYGHTDAELYSIKPDQVQLAGDLGFGRQFNPYFGLEVKAYLGKLKGRKYESAAWTYQAELMDFSLHAIFNISNLIKYNPNRDLSFSVFTGIGQTQYNSTGVYNGKTTHVGFSNSVGELKGSGIQGRKIAMTIPIGLILDYKINERVSANLNFRLNYVDTEKLDARQSGSSKDWYNFSSIGIKYRLGKIKAKKAYVPEPEKKEVVIHPPPPKKEEPKKEVHKKEVKKETPPPPAVKKEVVEKPKVRPPVEPKVKKEKITPEPEYRVQIRACFKKKLSLNDLALTYDLESYKIKEDQYANYYIYTYGSFATYEEAAKYRDYLKKEHNVTGAFIVTFSKGKRIHP
ncbi:MAG: hypothetical protein CL663_00030 [Bacteroidetes bacterium]|nr:hypothetical protein [Bacteroidota bacterium]